jgi:hypothetical protein
VYKTQDEDKHSTNHDTENGRKHQRKPKGQPRKDYPEKIATLDYTRHRTKTNKAKQNKTKHTQ